MAPSEDFQSYPGSHWHRWEPHVHAPGTIINDQFGGTGNWEDYLSALENATPPLRAIAITDYYSTETYERALEEKRKGRLPGCQLIFPNIEMRLGVGTVKGKWVNIHLLVSPEQPEHVTELKRFLSRLKFRAYEDIFACAKEDLIKLGRRSNPKLTDENAALRHGSEQFKVTFDDLRSSYQDSAWARENILIAVAGSETDGTSGVRNAADATLRQEVEKFAHVIFASSSAQRDFWLGRGVLSEQEICDRYGGLKPCLHGSDAHEQKTIGAPDGDRFSWVKGVPAFDTLRQACIDPVGRAFVGAEPPMAATPSQVITSVQIFDTSWAKTPELALNPGLVAIIGARGSGKTALADIIARGCDATTGRLSSESFLRRAGELLEGSSVVLRWGEGEDTDRPLDQLDDFDASEYPRARYLSQKFVDDLCSATGMTDELLREIERVIFENHPGDRDGTTDFDELRDLRTTRYREARSREEETLADLSDRIGVDLEKTKLVSGLQKQVAEKRKQIVGYNKDRAKLVSKGSEERVVRLAALTNAADAVRQRLRTFAAQQQSLLSVQDEVTNVRISAAPEALRKMAERHQSAGLRQEEWKPFLLDYTGDVDTEIKTHLASARKNATDWRGRAPARVADQTIALIPTDVDLNRQPLAVLEAEIARLEQLVNVDRDTANKYAALSRRISEETATLTRLIDRLIDCEGAKTRATEMQLEREAAYVRVFDAVAAEEAVLRDLYEPLSERLRGSAGSMGKLSFSVTREADIDGWAAEGEQLFDLRQQSTFRGKGRIRELAASGLRAAWETGDPASVGAAMTVFREENQGALLEKAPIPKSDQANYRDWLKRFAKWLYGTDHIRIRYSIDYDGVDIQKLSPGSRGIVLLLLYLALDTVDDRPLIIDQPEENLDPKSVFDELVGLFVDAKRKRQVIMVTHNANLVVNADADQIIIAEAGPHSPGKLPPIRYVSGGLESAFIRKAVCNVLEGGERAFQERARRLRVRLAR